MKIFRVFILLFILLGISSCSSKDDYYEVSNDYFNYESYRIVELSSSSDDMYLIIFATCECSIYEAEINVDVYNDNNKIIYSDSCIVSGSTYEQGSSISFYCDITKEQKAQMSYLVPQFKGKSKENPNLIITYYTVTFVNNNGTQNDSIQVKRGNTVSKPTNPKKTNYMFDNWYTDINLTNEYDFSKSVKSDITLYAGYTVDYASLTNLITTTKMKCNVTVYRKNYNTFLGVTTSSSSGQGSGIIFYESSNYYYVLTNNHVTVKESGYDKVSYTVEDYSGNSYEATLKYEDASYDLAVVYFKKRTTKLNVIDLAKGNPNTGDEIVAIGQPEGQNNAITYGKILSYVDGPKLSCEDYESNVTFKVICHNAETNHGSSGGALLNVNLELIGLVYAGRTNSSGEFVKGYAIPIEKIHEFLNKYIWSK